MMTGKGLFGVGRYARAVGVGIARDTFNIEPFDYMKVQRARYLKEQRAKRIREGNAVLLIDMQEQFLKKNKDLDQLVAAQLEVLDFCAEYSVPVVIIEFQGYGPTIERLKKALKNLPVLEPVKKPTSDSFYETTLADYLHGSNVNHLYLMGVYAGGCVAATARSARKEEFKLSTSKSVISHRNGLIEDDGLKDYYDHWHEDHKDLERILIRSSG